MFTYLFLYQNNNMVKYLIVYSLRMVNRNIQISVNRKIIGVPKIEKRHL